MEDKRLRNLILIPWSSVPIIMASYLFFWNRMPSEIAVHFSLSGNPVTLMSRTQSLLFDLITLLLLLTIGSWILLKRNINPERILVRYYFAIVAMTIISPRDLALQHLAALAASLGDNAGCQMQTIQSDRPKASWHVSGTWVTEHPGSSLTTSPAIL